MKIKQENFVRIAGLRLLTAEDAAASALECITSGRIDLAKAHIIEIIESVNKTQKDLSAALRKDSV